MNNSAAVRQWIARLLVVAAELLLLVAAWIFFTGWITVCGRRIGVVRDVVSVAFGCFALAALIGGRAVVAASLAARGFVRVFDKTTALAARRPYLLVGAAAAVYAALWTAIGALRYVNWWADVSDMGIPYQALWNTLHGKFYFSSLKADINLFHDHVEPFYLVFLPLVALFHSPVALVAAQNIALPFSALLLAALAAAKSDGAAYRWVVPVSFLAYAPLHGILNSDYHALAFVIPLLFAAFLGLARRRAWMFFVFALLAMSCKETVALTLAVFGLALAFGDAANKKIGRWLAAVALGVALLELKGLPALFHYRYTYAGLYSHLGPTGWQIALSPILRPRAFWTTIFNFDVLDFTWQVLGPALFLPLLCPVAAAPLAFVFAELILPAGNQKMSYVHHYASEIIPFLYYGLLCALPRAEAFVEKRFRVERAGAQRGLAMAIVLAAVFFYGRPESFSLRVRSAPAGPDVKTLAALLPKLIPPDAGVAANDCIMNHLLNRRYIYSIRHLPEFTDHIDYVIYDRQLCPINLKEQGWETEEDIICDLPYSPIYQTERFVIYQRNAPPRPR